MLFRNRQRIEWGGRWCKPSSPRHTLHVASRPRRETVARGAISRESIPPPPPNGANQRRKTSVYQPTADFNAIKPVTVVRKSVVLVQRRRVSFDYYQLRRPLESKSFLPVNLNRLACASVPKTSVSTDFIINFYLNERGSSALRARRMIIRSKSFPKFFTPITPPSSSVFLDL